jgi:hypothetical protein
MPEFHSNSHVTMMLGYVPTEAGSDQLYDEHVTEHPFTFGTKGLATLNALVADPDDPPRAIFLTGDAGHGKTYMCRRVLVETLGLSETEAFAAISTVDGPGRSDGMHDLGLLPSGNHLRIVKDLSDLDIPTGARVIASALEAAGRTTVICANEGRLRVALTQDGVSIFASSRQAVQDALASGSIRRGDVAVLDLNKQAMTAEANDLAAKLLDRWASDGRRWQSCGRCPAAPRCPILANRKLLGDSPGAAQRRNVLSRLVRFAETAGVVVTFRDLVATIALALTGGASCEFVQGAHRSDRWAAEYMFFERLFGCGLEDDVLKKMRLVRFLATVDPGHVAIRAADDALVIETEEAGSPLRPFWPVDPEALSVAVYSSTAAGRLAADEQELLRFLRRAAVFEVADSAEVTPRLGFQFAEAFAAAARGLEPAETVRLRNSLLSGLEVIQGLRRPQAGNQFMVVDPAFGTTGIARVIARTFSSTQVRVCSVRSQWDAAGLGEVAESVDWLDRRVVVVIGDGSESYLDLGLVDFEFLMRADQGLALSAFFEGTVRRLRAGLARVADETATSGRLIRVAMEGEVKGVEIDVDGRLVLGSGA